MARQRLSRADRELLAQRRLVRILDDLVVANMRTLEMKISDSGPDEQRVNPHVITAVRNDMLKRRALQRHGVWYYRALANPQRVEERLSVLEPLHQKTNERGFTMRLGQTLEISILRALNKSPLDFVGGFSDLDQHDDGTLYRKEEPPLSFSGRRMPGDRRFDFLAFHRSGPIGLEAKNIREWIYPDRDEIKELLFKAVAADTLPVLIGRRIPYVTFRLLRTCGVLVFENFNQLYPAADAALAAQVRERGNLGYHDVRTGNQPNDRLLRFVTTDIARDAEEFRERFNRYKDLLGEFGSGEMSYASFAARVRRRENGQVEDSDEEYDETGWPDHPDDMEPELD